jgi:hypothetical protein
VAARDADEPKILQGENPFLVHEQILAPDYCNLQSTHL